MFQDFHDNTNSTDTAYRLTALRRAMRERGIDGLIVPREDEFQGEYVPPCNERLKWLTGFGGSAGIAIILPDEAVLFVDGRYILQAQKQMDPALIQVAPIMTQKPTDWIKARDLKEKTIAIDPRLHSISAYRLFEAAINAAQGVVHKLQDNPIDEIWQDRPAFPSQPITIHPIDYAGQSSEAKREELARHLSDKNCSKLVIAQPENIAWLLNIRGGDVPHTPFALSYAIMTQTGLVNWYVDGSRVSDELRQHLGSDVHLIAPQHLTNDLGKLSGERIMLDPATTPAWFAQHLSACEIIESGDPIALPKARKNAVEIAGAQAAHIRDGVALCKFLHWLDEQAPLGKLTEIDAVRRLEQFRAESGVLRDISFDTIAGAGAHGAIVHYRVNENTNQQIEPNSLFLVDSGGQYKDGTTDVTRTVLIGTHAPDDSIDCFTRVLRGHIALAMARFPHGTSGAQLDVLARAPLWERGLDFDHGTGHGVGSYLSVHEGPQRIGKGSDVALQNGMIVSNEPGYYRAGHFGIRIENLQYVAECSQNIGERKMLEFHVLTLAPIDRKLIDASQLSPSERNWLNTYHKRVEETLTPLLPASVAQWLHSQCAAL